MHRVQHSLRHIPGLWLAFMAICMPFTYRLLPDLGGLLCTLWQHPLQGLGLLPGSASVAAVFASDSKALYQVSAMLLLPATGLAIWLRHRQLPLLRPALAHYLALQLLVYGMDKVARHQFPVPEANLLYTPLGQLSPDTIFWSSIGIVPWYQQLLGWCEVVPGLLLLHRRTRYLAALIALPVLAQVVAINMAYDISVKLHACQLLLTALYVAWPMLLVLLRLLRGASVQLQQPAYALHGRWRIAIAVVKAATVALILVEAIVPYTYSPPSVQLPLPHTAYRLVPAQAAGAPGPYSHLYVHSRGYVILQTAQGQMLDFALKYHTKGLTLHKTGWPTALLQWQVADSDTLEMRLSTAADTLTYHAVVLPIAQLPALQQPFHWSVEAVNE